MKKFPYLDLAIFTSLMLFACNDYELPESISVKQKASYEVTLGGSSFKVSEKFNVDKFKEALEDEDNEDAAASLTVYDYNPTENDSDVLQYILNYQIEGIDLGLTTDSDLDTIEFDTTFTAPDFSSDISSNLTLNTTLPIVELGRDGSLDDIPLYFNITSPDFDTMLIRSGSLDVSVTAPANVSPDFAMEATITLTNTSGNIIAGPSDPTDFANGGSVSLDLSGKTLVQNMLIVVSGSISGGVEGNALEYTVTASPNNIKFDTIKGLTMSSEDLGENATIEIEESFELTGINGALKSAKIEDGTLSFSCSYPDGWSGIVVDEDYFVLTGGLNLGDTDFTSKTSGEYILYEEATLTDKSVSPSTVSTYSGSDKSYIKFHLENATIVFADTDSGEEDSITLAGSCKINKIDELVIDLSALGDLSNGSNNEIDTGISFSTLLSDILDDEDEEISNLLNNVKFSDIKGYLLMTYPETCSDALSSISFSGNVTANYDSGSTTLLSSDSIGMKQSDKILSSYLVTEKTTDSGGKAITKEWIGEEGAAFLTDMNSAELVNMTKLLNARPDNLKIAYSLAISDSVTDVTLTGDDVDALTDGTSSINISLALVLPLKIVLNDEYDYPSSSRNDDGFITIDNVLKIADQEITEDLLNRDDENEELDYEKYIDAIKSVGITYEIDNTTGLEVHAYFCDGTVFDGTNYEPKELVIGESSESLNFTHDEIKKIFSSESYPFCPKIKLAIKEGDVEITRDAGFGVKAKLFVKTDGTVEIWNKNDE